ncbi:polyribonucleotide nucleotidyltransferase [Tanacetum coccineum]|uniref:Polyribonucleotide nucleotidyltransferase n=1 Tax=Tanacetum coccineum TaxID=301880 RepID=A0ABQ5BD58_9ASTR
MPCGACLLHKGFRTHLVWAAKWESYVAEVVSYKSLVIASLPVIIYLPHGIPWPTPAYLLSSVQHLIEKCLIFRMSKEECMEALSKHANIKPVITSTGVSLYNKIILLTNGIASGPDTLLSFRWLILQLNRFVDMATKKNSTGLYFVLEFSLANEVQHLIEKCLIFHMCKDECMEALSKHANINPVITSTVWKELEKENKEFFESYLQSLRQSANGADQVMSEAETSQLIQKMISDRQVDSSDNADK